MGKDKTLKGGKAPLFGINEVAYARESAIKGFIEPLIIARIRFVVSLNEYAYRFLKNQRLSNLLVHDGRVSTVRAALDKELSPIELPDSELITICEALTIQISFLETALQDAQDEFTRVCADQADTEPNPQTVSTSFEFIVSAPIPRFRVNEVVYLEETAQAVGRLEKMRVDGFEFDPNKQEWLYTFVFEQKPGENQTVGDRIDLRQPVVIKKFETELLTACEAIPLRVQFLQRALNGSRSKFTSICEAS